MKKRTILLLAGLIFQMACLFAAENTDKNQHAWPEPKTTDDYAQDPFFDGTIYKNGNTTIVQGETLGIDPASLHDMKLSPEDLKKFERHIVSVTNGSGTVTTSESHATTGLFSHSSTQSDQATDLMPGLTVTERKK